MQRLLEVEEIAPLCRRYVFSAPEIAEVHRAGQFVLVLLHDDGERIPLTIAASDSELGTVTLVVQAVGKTTMEMATLEPGDIVQIAGPLGRPTHIENWGVAVCIGGGVGIAPLLPIAGALKQAGNRVVSILGGRSEELIILREEMEAVSDAMLYTTDDGSFGRQGLVTQALEDFMGRDGEPDIVFAIGPAVMMRAVAATTKPFGIKTIVSLNTIMVDGTGMCGGCRVSVGGESKFVCVDGPEFDGHEVDFDLMMNRQRTYLEQEEEARRRFLHHPECVVSPTAGGSDD